MGFYKNIRFIKHAVVWFMSYVTSTLTYEFFSSLTWWRLTTTAKEPCWRHRSIFPPGVSFPQLYKPLGKYVTIYNMYSISICITVSDVNKSWSRVACELRLTLTALKIENVPLHEGLHWACLQLCNQHGTGTAAVAYPINSLQNCLWIFYSSSSIY